MLKGMFVIRNMNRAFSRVNYRINNKKNSGGTTLGDNSVSFSEDTRNGKPDFLKTPSTKSIIATPPEISKDMEEFVNYFPEIIKSFTGDEEYTSVVADEVMRRCTNVLEYCVPTGKKTRGLTTVLAYKMFEKLENLTAEKIKLANILGWCIELLQSAFLIVDDIVDNSETRRGAPCWFRVKNVGLLAVNDGIFLENGVYILLKKYLSGHACYVPIIELFHDVTIKSGIGQFLDNLSTVDGKPRLDEYTMERYKNIVKFKTGYYSFLLPINMAMHLANIDDADHYKKANAILLEIGEFFQIQDDFLDCFGDSNSTGKIGHDIRDGKCTWLAVTALEKATPVQRKIMQEHYGKPDEASIQTIRSLYEQLDLPKIYNMHEEEMYNSIRKKIREISDDLPSGLFFWVLENIHKHGC